MQIQTHNENPNFTIILPGPCQARCEFCQWEEDKENDAFMVGLWYALENLPENFTQISLSGGEPLLSPYFSKALDLIKRYPKFNKIVLTTNGINLKSFIIEKKLIGINHVNISRHSIDDLENVEVFKSTDVPSKRDLSEISKVLTVFGESFDLNFNCVFVPEVQHDVINWLKFLKETGIKSVTFRNQYDNFEKSQLQLDMETTAIEPEITSECPVCKTEIYRIQDQSFKFHMSANEPTDNGELTLNFGKEETYEVILQSNGNLTRDWGGNKILHIPTIKEYVAYTSGRNTETRNRTDLAGHGIGRTMSNRERLRNIQVLLQNEGLDGEPNEHIPSYSSCGASSYGSCG